MICPACQEGETQVVDSRPADHGNAIRRRRLCAACGYRFPTFESPEPLRVHVRKRDGSLEPFDREKLLASLRIACAKRPVTDTHILSIVAAVERDLARIQRIAGSGSQTLLPEANSQDIGTRVLSRLQETDAVASIRYASVFFSFASSEDFEQAARRARGASS